MDSIDHSSILNVEFIEEDSINKPKKTEGLYDRSIDLYDKEDFILTE